MTTEVAKDIPDTYPTHKKVLKEKSHEEETNEEQFNFMPLPVELRLLVICFLETAELLNISVSCKEMNELSKKKTVWKTLVQRHWDDVEQVPPDWRRYFYLRKVLFCKSNGGMLEWKSKDVAANSVPPARQSLSGTLVDGKIVFIGGQTSVTTRFDDIHFFDPDTKIFTKPKVNGKPPKFARHTSCAVDSKLYIFGGYDGFGTFFGLSMFDMTTLTWSSLEVKGEKPIPRTNHAVTSVGTNMYLFGGNDTTKPGKDHLKYGTYGDFQIFDTVTLTWYQPQVKGKIPCARSGHHMIPVGNKIYLFGGGLWNDKSKSWLERYNDMYVFDTETSEWSEITQINPPGHAFISLPHWGVDTFLFVFNDPIWCFDTITSTWHPLKTKGPRPAKRFLGPATFVPNRSSVFMFGGVYAQVMNNLDLLTMSTNINEVLRGESTEPDSSMS